MKQIRMIKAPSTENFRKGSSFIWAFTENQTARKKMAERVGVEPTHGLRRLTDFESAPLDHLGTFPKYANCGQKILYHIPLRVCNGKLLCLFI
jgi:hypothetical protein